MKGMSFEDAVSANQFRHKPDAKYDFLVFIGRFQPFHLGHRKVITEALAQANNVIVLVGSSNQPRSHRNPWSFDEREHMISDAFSDEDADRIIICPLEDQAYSNTNWVRTIQELVEAVVEDNHDYAETPRIGLIGYRKDSSSYYLKLFPQWDSVSVQGFLGLAATDMREGVFSNISETWLHAASDILPPNVIEQLRAFYGSEDYKKILDEYEFIRGYKQSWAGSPYVPTFVTTDVVVVQAGHVLLVRRGQRPGKGLLALPGGYLKADETIEDSALRELREETRIKIPDPVLRGSIVAGPVTFDDPHRDPRGRFITHAYLINLEPRAERGFKLPEVKGSDDADAAMWVPIAELKRDQIFLDHLDIVINLTARL